MVNMSVKAPQKCIGERLPNGRRVPCGRSAERGRICNKCRSGAYYAFVKSSRQVDLTGATCEEASVLSKETYIPCGQPAAEIVWHNKDRRAYRMCAPCADHNIRNRGGIRLVAAPVEIT